MYSDDHIIISSRSLQRLRRLAGFSWALGLLVCLGLSGVLLKLYGQRLEHLEALEANFRVTQAQQLAINEEIVKTTRLQHITADLLVTWGTYVRERTEIARMNIVGPAPLPARPAVAVSPAGKAPNPQ